MVTTLLTPATLRWRKGGLLFFKALLKAYGKICGKIPAKCHRPRGLTIKNNQKKDPNHMNFSISQFGSTWDLASIGPVVSENLNTHTHTHTFTTLVGRLKHKIMQLYMSLHSWLFRVGDVAGFIRAGPSSAV